VGGIPGEGEEFKKLIFRLEEHEKREGKIV
jgi:hypothetical protein